MGDIQREGVKRKFSGEDACHDDEDEKVADDANCVFVEHDISSSRIFQQNEIRSHKVPKGIPSNVCHVDQATPILQEEPAREQVRNMFVFEKGSNNTWLFVLTLQVLTVLLEVEVQEPHFDLLCLVGQGISSALF